jgi:prevent-host-death family protein
MIINSTDLKNNLGKYLRLSAREEIIITSNGKRIAKLSTYEDNTETNLANGQILKEESQTYGVTTENSSYEEFLELVEGSDDHLEYIDGQIYWLASPKASHQQILGELHYIFYNWFRGKKCQPMFAPFDITLKRAQEAINVVQPDLMVICDLEENLNEQGYYMGVPTLVLKIISESTRSKDFIKKLDLYMSTGVTEYWIVNPLNHEVSIYLFEDNSISKNTTYKNNETAASFSFPELGVKLAEVFG